MAVRVRVASADDVPDVLGVWERARSPAATTPDDADTVRRLLEHGGDALLVAEDDSGRVVGVLVATWDGWRGNMYRLAVLPSHRRRGVARQLVQLGHEQLRAKGARRVTALVGVGEDEALELWRAVGYERDDHVGRLVRDL